MTTADYIWNMAEKMKFSVSLDPDLGRALRDAAEAEGIQISTLVSHALQPYLDRHRVLREGLRAMKEYQEEHGRFSASELTEAEARNTALFGAQPEERKSA